MIEKHGYGFFQLWLVNWKSESKQTTTNKENKQTVVDWLTGSSSFSTGCCHLLQTLPCPHPLLRLTQCPLNPNTSPWKPTGEKWRALRRSRREKRKKRRRGRALMVSQRTARWDSCPVQFPHTFGSCRGGAGGGVAHRSRTILPGDGFFITRGSSTTSWGHAVHTDTTPSCHRQEEVGQLQRDTEEKKQAANQGRAGHLHWGGTQTVFYQIKPTVQLRLSLSDGHRPNRKMHLLFSKSRRVISKSIPHHDQDHPSQRKQRYSSVCASMDSASLTNGSSAFKTLVFWSSGVSSGISADPSEILDARRYVWPVH